MKNSFSKIALVIIAIVFAVYHIYSINKFSKVYKATTWDSLGYYMYLPSAFIYKDFKTLAYIDTIDQKYQLSGGSFYQYFKTPDGNYTGKYFCGVAILQMPYFFAGHIAAPMFGYPQDGFSLPYQHAIGIGAIFWVMIGFVFLRKVLLRFFDDKTTALVMLMLVFCSNLLQYVSVDSAQSHAYIFPLYSMILWCTIRWHESPRWYFAFLIGLICGLAVISRPTEIIIIFIPLLWNMQNKAASKLKWQLVNKYKIQIIYLVLGGVIGILPQLLYWQHTTGSLIYNVGSKWVFLNPWFRVLFGPEKGWFLYTPIAILMVLGLWKMKGMAFQKSVLVFSLLNIWIIIAWFDWRYGGSYSTRALVQSYPIMALALGSFVAYALKKKWHYYLYTIIVLLTLLNFYQMEIYNKVTGEGFSPFLKIF